MSLTGKLLAARDDAPPRSPPRGPMPRPTGGRGKASENFLLPAPAPKTRLRAVFGLNRRIAAWRTALCWEATPSGCDMVTSWEAVPLRARKTDPVVTHGAGKLHVRHEAARVHNAARRRGDVAARGARAAGGSDAACRHTDAPECGR